jgi:hypothetical protein
MKTSRIRAIVKAAMRRRDVFARRDASAWAVRRLSIAALISAIPLKARLGASRGD